MTDKFQQARHLYMTGAKTQKEIAEIVGVTERTIYNWIHQFAWGKTEAGILCSTRHYKRQSVQPVGGNAK